MKVFLIATALFCFISAAAQVPWEKPWVFVRVFDLQGRKIGKGLILSLTENTIQLRGNKENEPTTFGLDEVGYIRTRRSAGHNTLIGTAVGAGTFAILGVVSADPDDWLFGYSAAEGAFGGGVLGSIAGAAIGGITALFKNSVQYDIYGDPARWKAFKDQLQ